MYTKTCRVILLAVMSVLILSGCVTPPTSAVRPNETVDPTMGYLLARLSEDDVSASLVLQGEERVVIEFVGTDRSPLVLVPVPPGEYSASRIGLSRGNLSGTINLDDVERVREPVVITAGEIVYFGSWNVTFNSALSRANLAPVRNYATVDFVNMDERFPDFAVLDRRVHFPGTEDIDINALSDGETAFRAVESFETAFRVPPLHQAYITMSLLAELELLETLDFEVMDELRARFFSEFPAAAAEAQTLSEMVVGGYAEEGQPLVARLRVAPLNDSFRREGAQYVVVFATNLALDMPSGTITREIVSGGFNLLPTHNEAYVLFENGYLVTSSVFNETEELDAEIAVEEASGDAMVAINLSDTLVRDADPANDALIPRLLSQSVITESPLNLQAVAALNGFLYTVARGDYDGAAAELSALQSEFADVSEPSIRTVIDSHADIVLRLARRANESHE